MPIDYTAFEYIYPQRPEHAIPSSMLSFYERRGWIGQVKKNGTNSVIFVPPRGELRAMGRHKNKHKAWEFTANSSRAFKALQNGKWNVFNAELLHSKTKHIKDTNYIHDILVCDGEYLLDVPFAERYELLIAKVDDLIVDKTSDHFVLNRNTWVARNFTQNFKTLYSSLKNEEDEGLVLKSPTLSLQDKGASVKARVPHSNYAF